MFSGGHRKAAFSTSYPTDVLKAAAATIGPSLTPVLANTSLSQLHRMVECVQPMNPQDLQQTQPCGQLTVRPRSGVCSPTSTTDLQKTSPILMGMLTRTKDSVPPKRTSQPSGKRPYLDDDEILCRINEKLAIFKARMLELSKPSRTPQTSTTSQTSAPASPESAEVCDLEATSETQANKLALFKARMQKLRVGSFSNKPLNSAPQTSFTSQTSTLAPGVHPQNPEVRSLRVPTEKPESHCIRLEGPQGKITQTKMSAECGQTLKEEEDSPTVLQALSCTAVQEPIKENPSIIVHHSPADQECTLVGRSYHSHQNICKAVDRLSRVDCVLAVAESALSKTPEGKALKTSDRLPTVPDTWTAVESSEPHAISPAGHGNLLLNLSQIKLDVTFPVASFQKVPEPEQQERTEDLQKDQAEMEPPSSESEKLNFLKDPQYEDLTDYEEVDGTEIPPAQDVHIGAKGQSLCQMTVSRNSQLNVSTRVLTDTPAQQEPHRPLVCTCPYFVETDDGFAQVPCPKCEENVQFMKREVYSEDDSDSDELILFVTELDLKEEVVCEDSAESEETEELQDSNSGQHESTVFQSLEEFDTFDSFFNLKVKPLVKNLPNPAGSNEDSPTESGATTDNLNTEDDVPHKDKFDLLKPSAVEASEQVMLHCSLQNIGMFSPNPASEAEDGYDNEDTLKYPSQTQTKDLTASNRVRASSLLSPRDELPESNRLKWFPETSDEGGKKNVEDKVVKDATVVPKTARPVKSVESYRSKTCKKAKFKSRHIIYSDSESEDDEGMKNIEVSTQPPKQTLKLKTKPMTSKKPGPNSMGLGTTGLCCVSKSGSEEDDLSKRNGLSETSIQPPELCPKPNKYIKSRLARIQSLKPQRMCQANRDDVDDDEKEQITRVVLSRPRTRKPLQLEQPSNKRPCPTTSDSTSVKRLKRSSSDSGCVGQTMARKTQSVVNTPQPRPNALPAPETNAQNASRRQKLKDLFSTISHSLPDQSVSKLPEVRPGSATEVLSSGRQHSASSLPRQNSAGQTPDSLQTQRRQNKTQVKATPSLNAPATQRLNPPHTSLTNAKEVNSYSTVGSTSAKKTLVQSWADNFVPIPVNERRSSSKATHLKYHDSKRLKLNPKQRQKHPSQELLPPLMKKTILEAKQLTNAAHRKDQPPSIDQPRGECYEWKDRSSQEHTSEDWLEQMFGEPYHRPHY